MSDVEVPSAWKSLAKSSLEGVILVVGAADTGKTTLSRYVYERLKARHPQRAFLDGDMGQATLGPPTTMTLALSHGENGGFPPSGPRFRAFVGDISPSGHMLPTVVGAHKLVRKARNGGATAIVVDTTGLVAASRGGGALKRALVELLRADVVIGLQRESELEHLLVPLRRSKRTRVIDRPVASAARRRDVETRRRHRAEQYRRAFERGRALDVEWLEFAVVPSPSFRQNQLVALEDSEGLVLGVGIVIGRERSRHVVTLHTTVSSLEDVDTLRVGDVLVDPRTFQDERL